MRQVLFIYGFFAVDSLIKNYYRLYELFTGSALKYEDASDMWNASLMVSGVLVYPSFLFLQKYKILPFDLIDQSIIIVCTVFALIDAMDWFWNFNMRCDGIDWIVFAFINTILLSLKYINRPKRIRQ